VRTLSIPGVWYAEALPGGEYCALVWGSHIETHLGRVELPSPGENVLFLRCWQGDVFKMAGQSHTGRGNLEWRSDTREWSVITASSYGVNPVIYGRQGQVIINTGAAGSQGYRYIDSNGNPVSGDATYADPARQLWEYTTQGDITIGQGGWSAEGLRGSDRRVIVQGSAPKGTTFIRFNRAGDACAVAAIQGHGAEFRWFDASEWPSFPFLEPPVIEPEPEPMSIPNLLHVLQQVDRDHPDLIRQNTHDSVREFYWRAGWALHQADPNFGFLSKSAGENGQVINGHRVAVDSFAYKGSDQIVDAIQAAGDGPGTGGIAWGVDERRPSNVWVQPVPFAGDAPGPVEPQQHIYDGGENDTGECDKCGRPRADAIHILADEPGEPEPGDNALAMLARIEKKVDRLLTVFRV
jgi:hypothetical protein